MGSREAVVVAAVRSPVGRLGGAFGARAAGRFGRTGDRGPLKKPRAWIRRKSRMCIRLRQSGR